MTESQERRLCEPRYREEFGWLRCGLAVLERDPHARREDGCPGGLFVCEECVDDFCGFLQRAYDARVVRMEHREEEDHGFELLSEKGRQAAVKVERRQPTCSERQVSPFPQQLPIGELIAESDATVVGEAEDIEYHVVHEFRGARIPVVHLEKVQLLLEGCCIGGFARVCVASIHGPLSPYLSEIEERRHPPGGTFFGARVAILQTDQPRDKELGVD